ncbi:class I SAM-dependent methyltransferase, partial [Nonomuraea sp. NPDC004297]
MPAEQTVVKIDSWPVLPVSRLDPDLGCGGGQYFESIRSTGRDVIGLDYSTDQLRVARNRNAELL